MRTYLDTSDKAATLIVILIQLIFHIIIRNMTDFSCNVCAK